MSVTWVSDTPMFQISPMHARIGEHDLKLSFAPWRRRATLTVDGRVLTLRRRRGRYELKDGDQLLATAKAKWNGFEVDMKDRRFRLQKPAVDSWITNRAEKITVLEKDTHLEEDKVLGAVELVRYSGAATKIRSNLADGTKVPLEIQGLFVALPMLHGNDSRAFVVGGFLLIGYGIPMFLILLKELIDGLIWLGSFF